ncbi:Glutathione s-transferase [Thalictrum thalictroides]|uniref:glutathione transferase n=1 Tax=Thalictrum thalictroides TaxID=46969 RepID=A0A7J6W8D3_THATH|nr:Glutathione s-transferase [Thalictrum thalictroides]
MAAVKVYGMPLSSCTARVLTCLIEKGVEYELVTLNLGVGEHKQPGFLAKQPFGQIPVLEDGDLTLFESRAIAKYVAYKYKDQGTDLLRHENVKESAVVVVWTEVESQQYNPPISTLVYELLIKGMYGMTTDQAVVDAESAKFGKVLDVYEARLSENKYLAGNFYSLADQNHIPYTYFLMKTPAASLINDRPHVKAWWENISSRPSFQKVLANANAA